MGGGGVTHLQHLRPFLRQTPFHDRIEPLVHSGAWIRWLGYMTPDRFESVQSEYFAIRNGASLYDISPLVKYRITGRDAARFMDHLVTRDMSKVAPGRVCYTAWCDDDGKVIEEGTVFRLGENDFLLNAALHQLHWLLDTAYGFEVKIEEISDALCGLSLQGPTSREILAKLGVVGIDRLPHFSIAETTLDGRWLRIDRAGFTGDLGYELWVKPTDAGWLWDGLMRAGEQRMIAPIGSAALNLARIEAGFIQIDNDYIGALHTIRPSQRQSPFELGIGWAVSLGKPAHFVGRRALKREKEAASSRHILVGIDIEGRKPAQGQFLYADEAGSQEIGLTASGIWSPTLKKNIAFARVPPAYAGLGTELWIEIWYPKEHKIEKTMTRCRVVKRMFLDWPRRTA
jgi:aminomethyltransferase